MKLTKRKGDTLYSLTDIKDLAFHNFSVACLSSDFVILLIEKQYFDVKETCAIKMFLAGYFHDIGKWEVDPTVLFKKGSLDMHELVLVKKHTKYNLNKSIYIDTDVYQGIDEHHENFDGTGYPKGLIGNEISLVGRILRIVDVYDALRSNRSYKEPFDHIRALEEMEKMKNNFDPVLYTYFKEYLSIDIEHINTYYRFIDDLKTREESVKQRLKVVPV